MTEHNTGPYVWFASRVQSGSEVFGSVPPPLSARQMKRAAHRVALFICLAGKAADEKPRRGSTDLQEQIRTAEGWPCSAQRGRAGGRMPRQSPSLRQVQEEAVLRGGFFVFRPALPPRSAPATDLHASQWGASIVRPECAIPRCPLRTHSARGWVSPGGDHRPWHSSLP